jgi:hypothetical protein
MTRVRHLKDHRLEVSFSDGTVAELDFHQRLLGRGGVFRPLQSVEFFAQVTVDLEAGTLCWPNGVDLCPDVLYSQATGKSAPKSGSELDFA